MALRHFKDGIEREKETQGWNEDCGIFRVVWSGRRGDANGGENNLT